jgi:hypothetical protein
MQNLVVLSRKIKFPSFPRPWMAWGAISIRYVLF